MLCETSHNLDTETIISEMAICNMSNQIVSGSPMFVGLFPLAVVFIGSSTNKLARNQLRIGFDNNPSGVTTYQTGDRNPEFKQARSAREEHQTYWYAVEFLRTNRACGNISLSTVFFIPFTPVGAISRKGFTECRAL